MDGEWHWRGDTLEYFVGDVAVFKVDRIPRTGQPYCMRNTGVELSIVEQRRLEKEGLERYAKGPT